MGKHKFRTISIVADIIILSASFLICVWLKPASLRSVLPSHYSFFIALAFMWIIVSMISGKMQKGKIINYSTLLSTILISNIIAISITALIMYTLRDYGYSRTVVLGTAILATLLELLTGAVYISYKKAKLQDYEEYDKYTSYKKLTEYDLVQGTNGNGNGVHKPFEMNPGVVKAIEDECGPEIAKAILTMTSQSITDRTVVLSTTGVFNITGLVHDNYDYIINLHRINDIRKLDDFLDAVNHKLVTKGYFFCCVETKDQRKKRILKKYPPVLNYLLYSIDFVVKRILPKFKMTRGLYFFLTRGENAVISRAEALGRLSRSGFRIKQESFIGNRLYIEARKYNNPKPGNGNYYGPLIALPRVGREGEVIKVYKMRTMHPYSEYIQDYVYKLHDLQNGGKFKNDFRITSWGAFTRKVWLDELPMLINFVKGDMKLFGVRPLSRQYFELYTETVRQRRIKYKPGLIPPFYADMPDDLDSIQASELKYLDSFDKQPFFTDVKYLSKSIWNIVFRKVRSN